MYLFQISEIIHLLFTHNCMHDKHFHYFWLDPQCHSMITWMSIAAYKGHENVTDFHPISDELMQHTNHIFWFLFAGLPDAISHDSTEQLKIKFTASCALKLVTPRERCQFFTQLCSWKSLNTLTTNHEKNKIRFS